MCVETCGTSDLSDEQLSEVVGRVFDARPAAIIDQLDLLRPIYRATSVYGHFGRHEFPWERVDRIEELRAAVPVQPVDRYVHRAARR